ncbi:hypothetical protein [Burkholderia vietnamiensis]|uniref:hypothetical protein n=1 Tax=Burkholderia vietnamiensis TaxID=60552 RepID=UPI000A84C8BD|nr:hypothetical protein [Burkholderia vietnamiensis]CAG9203844.1 hypothetical protein BVI434_1860017 [Burkholderia vietnamiensis]CAJ3570100.1 Uncharacterised protein [Burkholderia pseudomallei]
MAVEHRSTMKVEVPESIRECLSETNGTDGRRNGGTSDSRKSLGTLKLTFAAQRHFHVARLPTHPERYADFGLDRFKEFAEALEQTTVEEWDRLADDLGNVYEKIQEKLEHAYPDGFVPLIRHIHFQDREEFVLFRPGSEHFLFNRNDVTRREVDVSKYGGLVALAALKAQAEKESALAFETDIITGWALEPNSTYGSVQIRRRVPIRDVLLAEPFMATGAIEGGEWLVMNRAPSGLMTVDPEDIIVPQEFHEDIARQLPTYPWERIREMRLRTTTKRLELPPTTYPPVFVTTLRESTATVSSWKAWLQKLVGK